MIVDCHTHLNRYRPDQPATLAERRAQLLAEMARERVDYALVLTSYTVNADRPSTAEVLAQLGDEPRLGVVAGVRLGEDLERELAELRGFLRAGQVKGLKLYPGYEPYTVCDPALAPVYALAREFGVPVMVHTGDTYAPSARVRLAHPLAVDEVAVEHRDVTFVICHLGNPWFTDAMEVVYKNHNVVADISGLTLGPFEPRAERRVRDKLNDVIAYLDDPGKLLFGSDWPISDVASYVRFAQKLEATPEELEGLMWRNAARVFRLEPPAPAGAAR